MRYVQRSFTSDAQLSNELRAADITHGPRVTSVRGEHQLNTAVPMVSSDGKKGMFISQQHP